MVILEGGALRRRDLAWANANSCAASGLAELDPPHASQSIMVILEGGALRRRAENLLTLGDREGARDLVYRRRYALNCTECAIRE